MQDPVAEIKNRLSIEDVVAPYVQMKKSGKYFKACCPFHNEKTPSFIISTDRQMAYCFGCHKGGDIFQFIQEIEGLDFRGALELLAEKSNVELPAFNPEQAAVSHDLKDRLKVVNGETSKFFVQQLWNTEKGQKVLEYVRKRAIKDEIIKEFAIGFAPDSKDALYRYLLDKKQDKKDILESTVAVARDSASQDVADRFHLRLMVPIQNDRADVVAFGGRALKKGDEPKYLNSPEYVLYNKSGTLYNLNRAKKFIRERDFVVFVEGYFDVMASFQAGVENVVATCGTALTEDQLKIVKRYTKNIVFAFDSDNAGQQALLRAVKIGQTMPLNLFVVTINTKDAAELIKEDEKLWKEAVDKKVNYLEHFENYLSAKFDLNIADQKKQFTDEFLEILEGVNHPVERDHYLKSLAKKVSTPVELLYDFLNQRISNRQRERKKKDVDVIEKKSKKERLAEYFLGMLLAFHESYFEVRSKLKESKDFLASAEKMGLISKINETNLSDVEEFNLNFADFLGKLEDSLDITHVYKEIEDNYNQHAPLNGDFYSRFENSDLLQKLALEAELKNPDESLLKEEFEKLTLLLYLDFISNKSMHGQN